MEGREDEPIEKEEDHCEGKGVQCEETERMRETGERRTIRSLSRAESVTLKLVCEPFCFSTRRREAREALGETARDKLRERKGTLHFSAVL